MEISAFRGCEEALPAKRGVVVQAKNTREALHSHLTRAQRQSETTTVFKLVPAGLLCLLTFRIKVNAEPAAAHEPRT